MKELLSDIDALLAELEDYAHGKDGDDITKMRARIAEEIKNQSQQTDGGELQNSDDMCFHECPNCNCRCNCHEQPCSCCPDSD